MLTELDALTGSESAPGPIPSLPENDAARADFLLTHELLLFS